MLLKVLRTLSSFVIGLGLLSQVHAHEGHDHAGATHGGSVVATKKYHFEVVLARDGITVYPLAPADPPAVVARLTGTATLSIPGALKPLAYRLKAASSALVAPVDLSKVPATGATVTFQVAGLPDPAEPAATFTVPVALGGGAAISAAKSTPADARAIAAQMVCPISKEALGSMGTPIKLTRGDRSIFLCCPACEKEVRADPDKYFGAGITVAPATKADQAAIDAQKVCPVSKEELGSMGGPLKVTLGGRSVFICCKGCAKDIKADPGKYLGTPTASAPSVPKP